MYEDTIRVFEVGDQELEWVCLFFIEFGTVGGALIGDMEERERRFWGDTTPVAWCRVKDIFTSSDLPSYFPTN